MNPRSNEEWLQALTEPPGEARNEALYDLRDYLLRAVLIYLSLHRSELAGWSRQDVYDLAEDLCQDALMKILASLDTFKGRSRFTSWAYRFVINQAASELRRYRYRDVSLEQLREEEPVVFQSLLVVRGEIEPERLAEQHDYINLLREIIEHELSERQRAAIVGVYLQGYSTDEMATALGLTRNALYKLLHDARRRLKANLLERHFTQSDILTAFED
jgi:RNA polymerase sigma-70 factor (ECF subfamily)